MRPVQGLKATFQVLQGPAIINVKDVNALM